MKYFYWILLKTGYVVEFQMFCSFFNLVNCNSLLSTTSFMTVLIAGLISHCFDLETDAHQYKHYFFYELYFRKYIIPIVLTASHWSFAPNLFCFRLIFSKVIMFWSFNEWADKRWFDIIFICASISCYLGFRRRQVS